MSRMHNAYRDRAHLVCLRSQAGPDPCLWVTRAWCGDARPYRAILLDCALAVTISHRFEEIPHFREERIRVSSRATVFTAIHSQPQHGLRMGVSPSHERVLDAQNHDRSNDRDEGAPDVEAVNAGCADEVE